MSNDVKRISLRIPEALHEKLTLSAEKNKRSINNEILTIIEKTLIDKSHSNK
ncbi:Arc family DNA-binding protein [Bacillus pumilus]|uniref:Arc family DNA-binding protein n=1 Tax=Bacillus pumilus TaxID=1408 RepID=UPI00227F6411|nr:Arc family DNA-binding protein [Bacillus pumilus]MCY7500085.1 Arc family DNA-binding protein [Bacillus pumilus]MCY7528591.1 Arc family DNA-binding protein [Bacillus pumilus]MED4439449.1 Arc family DNA-binding protein [Bacillus pumilus]MED4489892.1 Arc family DNA-binding protein [Bacillus pumilus]